MGCECHSDLNIISRATEEARGYSRYFVANTGLYMNSKLAEFVILAIRGVAGGGMMGPVGKINILSRKNRFSWLRI